MGKKAKYSSFDMDRYKARQVSAQIAGPVLLACEKCEQRLAKEGRFRQIAQLQRALIEVAEDAEARDTGLTILPVSCLDVCPRAAMAVALGARRGGGPAQIMVVRTPEELRQVCDELVRSYPVPGADASTPASTIGSGCLSQDPQTSFPGSS